MSTKRFSDKPRETAKGVMDVYITTIKKTVPVLEHWHIQLKSLEALCDKNKAKKNIAVDVAFNMAADDFLYDLEPGNLNASEYDLDDLDILNIFSEKIQEQIFICVGAEPKDPDICLSDAIDKLYEEGNLHQITEYITSMISDVDELVSLYTSIPLP